MIAEVQAECKLSVVPDDYVESFKPDLMDVIFAWSKVSTVTILLIAMSKHPLVSSCVMSTDGSKSATSTRGLPPLMRGRLCG